MAEHIDIEHRSAVPEGNVNCPACNKNYPADLTACPYCAERARSSAPTASPTPTPAKMSGCLKGALAVGSVIVAIAILGSIVGPKNSAETTNSEATSSDDNTTSAAPTQAPQTLPSDLLTFDKANNDAVAAYGGADNDLKKSVIRRQRDNAAREAVPDGKFQSWPGTIQNLSTDGDGDAYVVVKPDGCNCTLETTNNSLSEALSMAEGQGTLIKMGTPLFNKLMNMHQGDRVSVSGRMFKEQSLTEEGSIDEPAWLTRFSDISSGQ